MKKVLPVLFLICFCKTATALLCYTCSVGEQDVDTTCIDDPVKGATKTNCNKKYCTTIRQEYKDPQNKVASMYRGCEDEPIHMNEIIEDATYRIYYTACTETLCNGGSGKAADGGTGGGSLGDKSTLLVPGIGSGSTLQMSVSLIILLLVIAHLI
ncbi:uncharacterized protein BDFB_003041 [Asbolus verrucosus]|uniref:Uncharacterized protein n=1 Tax=Asbolus verrucosus TaxID=1661398 RepID=A0A482VCW4_ASBVE|nr:uncharacterized protein BDFB_003041 [Asbolus verrucosus]